MNIVRDEHGTMILKIDNALMASIIDKVEGKFRPYYTTNKPVFEITDDSTKITYAGMEIFLWKGTIIFPNEV
jgi:formylmethanofuran dehydrogenase subunit A